MLIINVSDSEYYNSEKNEFIKVKGGLLYLEHSLISISKWESRWNKPFLTNDAKSTEEALDYIKCMTINSVDENIYLNLSNENMKDIDKYINLPMTATTFLNNKGSSREIITNEIIYYWMFTFNISKECEKWHLSRLLTLIRVCSEKNKPAKKMSKNEIYSQQRAINEARRKKYNTKG